MYTIIVNPTSGSGASLKNIPKIEALLREKGAEFRIVKAETPERATELAQECTQNGTEGVIAVGGDGTLFRIVNGLTGSDTPLIFAPCGTGNDFVRSLKLPKDPIQALRLQLDSPMRKIDVGRINDMHFLNVSGTGFDVEVLRQADKYKAKFRGLLPYLLGLFDAIRHFKPMTAQISIDDQPAETVGFTILSLGNGRYIGGGMKAVPEAEVDDGLFDLVIVHPVKKVTIFMLVMFYVLGLHVKIGLAKQCRCRKIAFRQPNATINIDGELYTMDAANYEICKSALTVRVPVI